MNKPVYDFYIGSQLDKYTLLTVAGERRDPVTGLPEPDPDFISTLSPAPVSAGLLFVGTTFENSDSLLYCYDQNEDFISSIPLSSASNYPVALPSNAAYVAVSFRKTEKYLLAYTPDSYGETALKRLDFLYQLQPCEPVYKKLTKKYEKDGDRELFREKLEGSIKFLGPDFNFVYSSRLDTKFTFVVMKHGLSAPYFTGYFRKTDCEFDLTKQSCKVTLSDEDRYSPILDAYDHTYDLMEIGVPLTPVNVRKRPVVQIYIKGESRVTNVMDGTYWEGDVLEVQDNADTLDKTYHFTKFGSFGEFVFKAGPSESQITDILTDLFSGSFQGSNTIKGLRGNLTCELVKVASVGDTFTGEYAKNQVTGLYSREQTQNYFEITVSGGFYFANDTYVIRVKSKSGYSFESSSNFYIDSPSNKVIGSGADITFRDTTEGGTPLTYAVITDIFVNEVFQRLLCDVDTIETPEGGTKNTYDVPQDDFVQDNRNYKKCYGLDLGEAISTEATSAKPTRYGKDDNTGLYFAKPRVGQGGQRMIPLNRNAWVNISLWYRFSEYYKDLSDSATRTYTMRDGYDIAGVISALLSKISPGIRHEAKPEYSEFLYGESQPVTGPKFWLFITQKTNILKGDYDQAAQKAEITFESLMGMLQNCFRCYWWVEDGKLRIEHITWFLKGRGYGQNLEVGTDLTVERDRFNRAPVLFAQTGLSYDLNDLPARYEFNYMDDGTEPFSGVYINVDANYIAKEKTESTSVSDFSADIDYMLASPENFSEDGFAVIGAVQSESGAYEIPVVGMATQDENGDDYTLQVQNGYLSWYHLIKFYMYDMPAERIDGNYPQGLSVSGVKAAMKHTIEAQFDEDPDIYKGIKTEFGNGKIEKVEIDIDTRKTSIELSYEPK